MQKLILVLLFMMAFSPFARASLSTTCEDSLRELFSGEINREEAGEFLKLQADITLHRLAWVYLKAQKEDQDQRVQSTERTILELLNEKYTNSDPEFVAAREAYEAQPLSRTALAEIAPYLQDALSQNFGEESRAFLLNSSDLKLLAAIAKQEKAAARNGIYDHRMLDSRSSRGMLNFVKLINSSYNIETTPEEENLNIDIKLNGLERTMRALQARMTRYLDKLKVPVECLDTPCEGELPGLTEIFNANEDVQRILWESLGPVLESDDLLIENLSYRQLWLRVATRGATSTSASGSNRNSTATRDSNPGSTTSADLPESIEDNTSIPQTRFITEHGQIIDDPVDTIVRDRSGRSEATWQNFDRDYLESMATAIINDDKVFLHDGRLFNRMTGRGITTEQALALLPAGQAAQYRQYLRRSPPEITLSQVRAMVNGEQLFIHGDRLYNLRGMTFRPEEIIAQEMTFKTGIEVRPERYEGMEINYLNARARAIYNDQPNFRVGDTTFHTESGRTITSPARRLASQEDVNIGKERRRNYENLTDREVIANFHRDFPQPNSCDHYAIVDKQAASIQVFSHAGEEVFSAPVLVGARVSDEITDQATGAGVYTIAESNESDENQITLNQGDHEQVLTIHQIPQELEAERSNRLQSTAAEDRRVSGGSVNMNRDELIRMNEWLDNSCQVYVLPEEEGNSLVLRNNQINFVSENPIPTNRLSLYNFNPNRDYSPIQIRINGSIGNTATARQFVDTLEAEKQRLMRLFNLSNDDYNDLAVLAFGILGNESEFGRGHLLRIKEFLNSRPVLDLAVPSAKWLRDRINEGEASWAVSTNTSRGFTQIKNLPPGEWREHYPDVNKDTLNNPRQAAIATMAYLIDAVHRMKSLVNSGQTTVPITRENMVDYLGYLYMGRAGALTSIEDPATPDFNIYVQNLRRNMSYIEISQQVD